MTNSYIYTTSVKSMRYINKYSQMKYYYIGRLLSRYFKLQASYSPRTIKLLFYTKNARDEMNVRTYNDGSRNKL